MYQDNQSAIKMKKNGRHLCTGKSSHINIRYFFVHNRVKKGEIKVEYCPMLLMLSDYFTKPLMRERFREIRKAIMGHVSIFDLNPKLLQPIKKHIGEKKKL